MDRKGIYQEIILDHAKNPRNSVVLENPDIQTEISNPLCGDEILLTLIFKKKKIFKCGLKVRGCAICQASSSMMSEKLIGESIESASEISKNFQTALIEEIKEFPNNIKDCLLYTSPSPRD